MGTPRRALKFAMISSACLSRSDMVLGTNARSLTKGEAALAAGLAAGGAGSAGRDGRAPGALFAVSFLPTEPSGL